MWLTAATAAQLPDLTGMRLAAAVHLDIKAAVFLEAFAEAGAQVAVMPVNPATTRSDVATYLNGRMRVFAMDAAAASAEACLDWDPTHTLEMGADLTMAAVARGHDGTEPTSPASAFPFPVPTLAPRAPGEAAERGEGGGQVLFVARVAAAAATAFGASSVLVMG